MGAPQELVDLVFNGPLDDQLRSEPAQLAQVIWTPLAVLDEIGDALFKPAR